MTAIQQNSEERNQLSHYRALVPPKLRYRLPLRNTRQYVAPILSTPSISLSAARFFSYRLCLYSFAMAFLVVGVITLACRLLLAVLGFLEWRFGVVRFREVMRRGPRPRAMMMFVSSFALARVASLRLFGGGGGGERPTRRLKLRMRVAMFI